jgi:hypothetical protein
MQERFSPVHEPRAGRKSSQNNQMHDLRHCLSWPRV